MSKEKRIETLKTVAEQKKQNALDGTEKAINKLIKEGKRISFSNVAREAGVSISYLYKYAEIKERIQQLRNQYEQTKKANAPQPASDRSKMVMINQLRERIKNLEAEKDGLRRAIEGLTGRLYQYQGIEEQLERFRVENMELKQQLEECRHDSATHSPEGEHQKVTLLDRKRTSKPDISSRVKQQLEVLEIKLNSTLLKTIKSVSEETVLNAIKAFQEASTICNIERPGAWLKKAIEEGWIPNEQFQQKSELDSFKEWFPLAKQKNLVLASQTTRDGIIVYTNEEQWIPFQEMLAKHPLSSL